MVLDPQQMADESSYEGHLDHERMAQVLGILLGARATGRVTVRDGAGANHMFFMQGRPVGVVLSMVTHPLGQLLLELGKVDSSQFVRAQRLIGDGDRLPGQVFIELGAITDAELKETLTIQARRKAQKFASLKSHPFEFSKGLSFLIGFKSSPMEGPPLVFHALAAELDESARRAWLGSMATRHVRATSVQLGASLEAFGFGRAEERFFQRMTDWNTVEELDQFGTLPSDEVVTILRFLEAQGQLEVAPEGSNPKTPPAPAPAPRAPAPVPVPVSSSVVVDMGPPTPPPPRKAARTPTAPVPMPAVGGGPVPNSAVAVTRAREVADRKPADAGAKPSVVIDLDASPAPPKR